jgi:SPP1 gp7 family putative phage head morphogenesis protein
MAWVMPRVGKLKQDAKGFAGFQAASARVIYGAKVRAGQAFDRMSRVVNTTNATAIESLGIVLNDKATKAVLAKARDENIKLVEDAGREYASSVRELFDQFDVETMRVETLQSRLMERGDVSESRAELIARDQVLKLNGKLTESRQTGAGIDRYTWSTSQDERVRDSHRDKEGEVFSWDDPPEDTGHPGQDYQCRCVAIPYFEEVDGPAAGDEA